MRLLMIPSDTYASKKKKTECSVELLHAALMSDLHGYFTFFIQCSFQCYAVGLELIQPDPNLALSLLNKW